MKKLMIWIQECRVAGLQQDQQNALDDASWAKKRAEKIGFEIVCASLYLARLRGEIPSPVRQVIPTKSRRFFAKRAGGFAVPELLQRLALVCLIGVAAVALAPYLF